MNLFLRANQKASIALKYIAMIILTEIFLQTELSLEITRDSFRLKEMLHFLILYQLILLEQMMHWRIMKQIDFLLRLTIITRQGRLCTILQV